VRRAAAWRAPAVHAAKSLSDRPGRPRRWLGRGSPGAGVGAGLEAGAAAAPCCGDTLSSASRRSEQARRQAGSSAAAGSRRRRLHGVPRALCNAVEIVESGGSDVTLRLALRTAVCVTGRWDAAPRRAPAGPPANAAGWRSCAARDHDRGQQANDEGEPRTPRPRRTVQDGRMVAAQTVTGSGVSWSG